VLLIGSLFGGVLGGLLDWRFDPGRVAPGDTLAAHLAWRAFSAATSATVCGLILYSLVRPLTTDRMIQAAVLPTVAVLFPVPREHFLQRLLLMVPIGLMQGVILRFGSGAARRRAQSPQG